MNSSMIIGIVVGIVAVFIDRQFVRIGKEGEHASPEETADWLRAKDHWRITEDDIAEAQASLSNRWGSKEAFVEAHERILNAPWYATEAYMRIAYRDKPWDWPEWLDTEEVKKMENCLAENKNLGRKYAIDTQVRRRALRAARRALGGW